MQTQTINILLPKLAVSHHISLEPCDRFQIFISNCKYSQNRWHSVFIDEATSLTWIIERYNSWRGTCGFLNAAIKSSSTSLWTHNGWSRGNSVMSYTSVWTLIGHAWSGRKICPKADFMKLRDLIAFYRQKIVFKLVVPFLMSFRKVS